jgi:serine/threonine protein kinase
MSDIAITKSIFIKENKGEFKTFYKLGPQLGSGTMIILIGAFGEVRKCQDKKTQQLRAVKILSKDCMEIDQQNQLLDEITILKQLVQTYTGPSQHCKAI